MSDHLKDIIASLPSSPGVYFFKNAQEEIIYIGKAINIRKRIRSHFSSKGNFTNFYSQVAGVDFIETPDEKSALVLENQLIKKHQPKYNIELKDDKDYSYVVFTAEAYPRVFVTHQPFRKGNKEISPDATIIGPFVSGYELKKFLFNIRKLFPYRTCKNKPENPCLYHDLGLCFAHGKEAQRYPLVIAGLRALVQMYNGEPVRTECYDISNTQGSLSVGSMVSFISARPNKKMYRKFKIRTVEGSNDPRSLREVLDRRLTHTEWTYPDLILIDGGRSQLSKLRTLSIPLLTIAKFNREKLSATIFSPFSQVGLALSAFPVEISQVFLRARDEAHRFAIIFHRSRRERNLLE